MAGVEAAASLFGSEDSGSDLFATLGATSSPAPPPPPEADLFFNTTSNGPEAGLPDDIFAEQYPNDLSTFLSESQPGAPNGQQADAATEWNHGTDLGTHGEDTPSTYSGGVTAEHTQYSSSPYDTYGFNSVGQSQAVNSTSTPSTYGYSAPAPAKSYSSYSAYDPPPPKALPTRSVYDTYTPPAPQSSYQSYEHHTVHAPNGQAYGAYGAPVAASSPYDPPATTHPATHSLQDSQPYGEPYNQPANNAHSQPQRSPYDPPAHAQRKPFEVPSNSYSGSMYSPPAAVPPPSFGQHSNVLTSPPPPPPPIKSTIVRPKVSNAYDPPLPSISARRPLRASASQQFQAQYQTPMEKYAMPPPPPPQMPPPPRSAASYDQYSESFSPPPNVPPNGRRVMTPPHVTHQAESHPPSDYFPPQPATLPVEETVQEPSTHISDDLIPEDSLPDDPEGGVGIPELPQSRPSSTKPFSPPHALNALSPSLIPLPDSPSPEHHPYASKEPASPAPKPPASEPDVKKSPPSRYDPYAPKTTHTMLHNHNNYIPRTSSPLSIPNGHTSDIPKPSGPPPRSNLNNSAPIPKPLNPASFHSNYAIEQDFPRTTESKLAPSDALSRHLGAQYAPSPSLIGANDPLSRTSARAPAISFGFGGKLVTCFHGMPGLNAGFDVAFSSRTSSELKIRTLSKVVPELAQGASYPGPLLSDPGTSSISLVRQTATQAKSKKASVLSYLTDRITELEQGVGYLGNAEKQQAEDKIVLIKLLKAMVESDGRLLGTPQAETAVRSALVPRIDVGSTVLQDAVSLQATYTSSSSDGTPIAVTTLRASSLDKIEELLLQGDRRQAYQYAMTEKLWAHAMIIASSIDKDAWKEVAHDFLRTELGTREDLQPNLSKANGVAVAPQLHTRESLRVAYSLFSGSGGAAVQELVSQSLLQRSLGRLPAPVTLPATTPRTPNFAAVPAANIYPPVPPESLSKWADTAAMIISSPLSTDYAAALTALGDQLLTNNFVEAAHACYLLSPQTSLIGGLGSSTARLTLVGTKNPGRAAKDKDAIIFSEIFEFAMSLVPTVKGQEPFHGLAQLQTYRFIRAVEIAENGDLQLANRYCDAITACLSHAPNYGNTVLLEQLQGLQQRLSGVFHGDKANSWIGGKISKPSLDSIGGWLEGRFTKLVTGDEDEAAKDSKPADQPFVGPFAQYSAISSTTPSARSSPQPPSAGIPPPPPQRTASAMAHATPYMPPYQGERSSSAMGYSRQRPPVQIGANGSSAASLASSQSSPTNFGGVNQYNPPSRTASMDEELETPVQASSWWSQSEASNATPTNATFMKVDAGSVSHSDDGFISLMDSNSYSVGPSTPLSSSSRYNHDDDEDDDLGLGNSKPKPPKPETDSTEDSKEPPKQAAPAAAEKPASTPAPAAAAGGSWLKPWTWRKGADAAATPGPVKASLGDSNAFYYDKEQKRWINKNAAAEPPKPAAPPPPPSRAPSRAQTASPGMSHGPKPPLSAPTPPPPRSVSAMDMSGEPPKAPMRIRSNLAPPTESAPSTPTGSRLTPGAPPPARPRSQAAKRNIRSRYVDVLQQEPSA